MTKLLALTKKREIILIEQFRIPINANVIELPAGLIGDVKSDDNDPSIAAKRELLEETGYECKSVEILCKGDRLESFCSFIFCTKI